ncbi:MAG: hypothetical protein K2G70_04100 [Turicibacter sp.]|nr:hypothetical protein [Turicibacter sp.]
MENKAEYADLRRTYFTHREQNKMPSHSNGSNFELGVDESLETISSRLKEVMTSTLEKDDMFSKINEDEKNEFKAQLSQHSNDLMNALADKYGTRTYSKITQMIQSEDFSEWEQLEHELLSVQGASFSKRNSKDITPEISRLSAFKDSVDELVLDADADLDYLDALVQHDYNRLRQLQSNSECISSIFSEIIENEQQSHTNYQDDIFNKNIELIFNSDIDLDASEWEEMPNEKAKIVTVDLNEAIDQLKQNTSLEVEERVVVTEHKQANLEAFYSDQLKEVAEENITITEEIMPKTAKQRQQDMRKLYSLIGVLIVLAILVYIML